MAAPVAVERVGGVTRVGFRVPEGTDAPVWWRSQVNRYASEPGATIPAEVEAAWLLETASVCDRIIDPGLARSVPPSAGVKLPPRVFGRRGSVPRPEVDALTAVNGRPWAEVRAEVLAATTSASPEVLRRLGQVEMMLAEISIMRDVVSGARARVVVGAGNAAGEFFTVLAVGSVIVAAVALDEYFDAVRTAEALRAAADERAARARIAQAGQDYRARLEALRTSGAMPPPSATETAVAADVQRRAASEWDNFWRAAQGAAQGAGKGLVLAAVAALLVFGTSRR